MGEPRRGSALRTAAALAFLHALAVFPLPWEADPLAAWSSVSPDLALLLALSVAASASRPLSRRCSALIATLVLSIPAWRFGATFMPSFYGKPFEPYHDVLLLPGLDHLLTHRLAPALHVVAWIGFVLALVALWMVTRAAVRRVSTAARGSRAGIALLAGLQLVATVAWIEASAGAQSSRVWRASMALDFVRGALRFARVAEWRVAERFAELVDAASLELAETPRDLERLGGADVYVVFVESYGRVLYDGAPDLVGAWAGDLEARLSRAGFTSISGFARPSVRGGLSSVAHGEFLSGVPVGNAREFALLLDSRLEPLPRHFAAAGYRTIHVQPGMPRAWPEGREFYGFVRDLFAPELGYDGLVYHWGTMPDQYALARLLDAEVRGARAPLFVQFVSVTSHAPFTMIPPYVDDWSAAREASAYAVPARRFPIDWSNFVGHPQVGDAFRAAIRYSLDVVAGFAAELDRPSLIVVLGDHQPPILEAGRRLHGERDVAIHAIANRDDLLEPFRALGFRTGMVPAKDAVAIPTARLPYVFLRGYSRG